jgi:hypothetical protein
MTTTSAAALIHNGQNGCAISKSFQNPTAMANDKKMPPFVKSETEKGPVQVDFIESGVAYGYAYTEGETGIVREGDVKELVQRKVVSNPRPVVEKATAKTTTQKAAE